MWEDISDRLVNLSCLSFIFFESCDEDEDKSRLIGLDARDGSEIVLLIGTSKKVEAIYNYLLRRLLKDA